MNTLIKNIFTTILLTVFVFVANAQDKNFHFGLKGNGGLYWTKSNDDTTKANGSQFGIGYGLMLEFGFTSNYYFLTGVEINDIGTKTKYEAQGTGYSITSTSSSVIKYVELPLMLKMKTKEIGMMKYWGMFGLKTGFAISAKNSWETTSVIGTTTTKSTGSDKKTDDIFPLREALVIGGGGEYNLSGNTSLVFGVAFDNGFTPVLKKKSSKNSSVENPQLFSKGVVLTLGIIF